MSCGKADKKNNGALSKDGRWQPVGINVIPYRFLETLNPIPVAINICSRSLHPHSSPHVRGGIYREPQLGRCVRCYLVVSGVGCWAQKSPNLCQHPFPLAACRLPWQRLLCWIGAALQAPSGQKIQQRQVLCHIRTSVDCAPTAKTAIAMSFNWRRARTEILGAHKWKVLVLPNSYTCKYCA